jgi:hypothetical protein
MPHLRARDLETRRLFESSTRLWEELREHGLFYLVAAWFHRSILRKPFLARLGLHAILQAE